MIAAAMRLHEISISAGHDRRDRIVQCPATPGRHHPGIIRRRHSPSFTAPAIITAPVIIMVPGGIGEGGIGADGDHRVSLASHQSEPRRQQDANLLLSFISSLRPKPSGKTPRAIRTEKSCWVRGDFSRDPIFFMDNADPQPESSEACAFYNKAPQINYFKGEAYFCDPLK